MHMRKKPFAMPELEKCGYFVERPDLCSGRWKEHFSREASLHVELGCGKAVSTAQMARANPGINYIAIDMSPDILGVARRNIEQAYAPELVGNILLVRWNIDYIDEIFSVGDEVSRIYINFCNPWTQRTKHAKRRLTSPQKLMMYRKFLRDGGEIYFKTDNEELFEDSLCYLQAFGFENVYMTRDLHASGFSPNYESEHERLYTQQGIATKFVIAKKRSVEIHKDAKQWLLAHPHAGNAPRQDGLDE